MKPNDGTPHGRSNAMALDLKKMAKTLTENHQSYEADGDMYDDILTALQQVAEEAVGAKQPEMAKVIEQQAERIKELEEASDLLISVTIPTVKACVEQLKQSMGDGKQIKQQSERVRELEDWFMSQDDEIDCMGISCCAICGAFTRSGHHTHCLRGQIQKARADDGE